MEGIRVIYARHRIDGESVLIIKGIYKHGDYLRQLA